MSMPTSLANNLFDSFYALYTQYLKIAYEIRNTLTEQCDSLTQADRDTLDASASKLSTHVTIGSLVGMGLGIALAWRIRSNRVKFFNAFRATQKPTHVKFADGREGSSVAHWGDHSSTDPPL